VFQKNTLNNSHCSPDKSDNLPFLAILLITETSKHLILHANMILSWIFLLLLCVKKSHSPHTLNNCLFDFNHVFITHSVPCKIVVIYTVYIYSASGMHGLSNALQCSILRIEVTVSLFGVNQCA